MSLVTFHAWFIQNDQFYVHIKRQNFPKCVETLFETFSRYHCNIYRFWAIENYCNHIFISPLMHILLNIFSLYTQFECRVFKRQLILYWYSLYSSHHFCSNEMQKLARLLLYVRWFVSHHCRVNFQIVFMQKRQYCFEFYKT